MKESLLLPTRSSLVERAQKIRARMLIEQVSGISAANRLLFLSLCQTYEGGPVTPRFLVRKGLWARGNKAWDEWEKWDQGPDFEQWYEVDAR